MRSQQLPIPLYLHGLVIDTYVMLSYYAEHEKQQNTYVVLLR